MEFRRLCKDDYDELLSVLNKTFGHKNGHEVDFLNEQPKMWVRDDEHMGRHYGIFEDGKLVSVTGMYPLHVRIGGVPLLFFTTGNVATLPEYEGRGYFTKIFTEIMKELERVGADGARLGGARQRYARHGFQPAGTSYRMTFTEDNRVKYFGDGGTDITFREIERDDIEALKFVDGLYHTAKIYVERGTAEDYRDVYLSLGTKHCAGYLALRGNEPIGYLAAQADNQFVGKSQNGRNILEMNAINTECYIDILCAWQRRVGLPLYLNIGAHRTDVITRLIPGVEGWFIQSPSHFKILNYEKLTDALLKIKDKNTMLHGSAVIEIEGYGKLELYVNGDGAGCRRTDKDADITLDRAEATRTLFGFTPPLAIAAKAPLLASWLPLPMSWDTLDYT